MNIEQYACGFEWCMISSATISCVHTELYLCDCKVDAHTVTRLAPALALCGDLECVDLSNNQLGMMG